jgi:hypothetical protein
MLRMCVLDSCFIENYWIWILEGRPLISEVVVSRQRWNISLNEGFWHEEEMLISRDFGGKWITWIMKMVS